MDLFFDTSALVKIFSEEQGSEKIRELVFNPENKIFLLDLCVVELMSTVFRKWRNHEIPDVDLDRVISAIEKQIGYFEVIPLHDRLVNEAKILVKGFGKTIGLRTLDAIHIAGWLGLDNLNCMFITSDKNQFAVVKQLQASSQFF